jgi:hypothetical protein
LVHKIKNRDTLIRASDVFPEYRTDTHTIILLYSHLTNTTMSILIHSIHHPVRDPYIVISALLSPSSSRARMQELFSFVFQSTNTNFGLLPMAVAATQLLKKHSATCLLYHRGSPPWPSPAWRSRTRAALRAHATPPSTSPVAEGEAG